MNDELAQLHRDVAAWERQVASFRVKASDLEVQAQRKWNDVAALEARIVKDMAQIAELEHGR